MQRVITVSLNRNAFSFEEDAHRRLAAYIESAQRTLAENPDRAEVINDLEQAIADQCTRRLRTGQTVITLAELEPALAEIGEVEIPGGAGGTPRGEARTAAGSLQQISEGAVISGVCKGLAQITALDVTLVRVIAVLLLFLTGGGMVFLYLLLMLLIPFAPHAAGSPPLRGLPAKSREFVTFVRGKLGVLTH